VSTKAIPFRDTGPTMRILSYNPGHDGAVAYLQDGRLVFSIEAEKDSNWRYMPASPHDLHLLQLD